MPKTAFEWINLLAGLMFLLSAAVQYNDPDPLAWMVVYGAGGLACLVPRPPGLRLALIAFAAVSSLGWAVFMLIQGIPGFQFGDLFKTMKAETPSVELGREVLGLLMVTAWMVVLLVRQRRAASTAG